MSGALGFQRLFRGHEPGLHGGEQRPHIARVVWYVYPARRHDPV